MKQLHQRIASAGFMLGLMLVVAIATLVHRQLSSLQDDTRQVAHTHRVLETAQNVELGTRDASIARRSFAQTHDEAALVPFEAAIDRENASLRALRELTQDNDEQQRRVARLEVVIAQRIVQLRDAVQAARDTGYSPEREVALTAAGDVLLSEMRSVVGELKADELRLLGQREAEQLRAAESTQRAMRFGFGVSVAMLLVAFVALNREAGLRRRSEQALAAREQRLAITFDSIADAVIATDAGGLITHLNPVAQRLTGWPAAEAKGRPFAEVFHAVDPKTRSPVADPAARVLTEGATPAQQLALVSREGRERPIAASAAPIVQTEAKLDGAVVVFRDVSRQRALERFRDEYVGYISHDLKNPLSIISLHARLLARLLDGRAPGEAMRSVVIISESAGFIDALVREMLEMAYVESDELKLQLEPISLGGFLRSVIERAVSSADRQRVELVVEPDSVVSAESRRLERVVVNFIQNALKYSPPGSPIQVRAGLRGERAVLSVVDQGPGIAAEEQAQVFEKFRRAASARDKEGVGLGLYISRKIVEAHGGTIGVESAVGHGATFSIELPRLPGAVPVPEAKLPAPVANELRGLRVLLVDDEVNAVSALETLLSDEGIQVSAATTGEQGLALAEAKAPDVAVVDVQMPGMSGLVLLERLRARFPGLPAVIMSGHLEQEEGIAGARASGGVAYVGKPVDVDELLQTLTKLSLPRRAP